MLRTMAIGVLLFFAAVAGSATQAGTGAIKLGDPAPEFKNLPGIDGKNWSLSDFKQDLLVICITCNHCPVAMGYEPRIIEFNKKYATGKDAKVGFIAVCVSDLDVDSLDKTKARAQKEGFNFTYLYDGSQKIARQLNAHVTPEFYLFDKNRKLVYSGPFDDDLEVGKVKVQYLAPAVDALLAGKAVPNAQVKAFGCAIDYIK